MSVNLNILFWAGLWIAFGSSLLLNTLFGINLPITELFLGVLLIYAGFKLLLCRDRNMCGRKKMGRSSTFNASLDERDNNAN